ncbi:MAG: glycosyltransferase family 2 protein [Candidatus Methanoperedenaceae archaeon]|nr:glycosyltransferase family 2 protein [Candidatus Methanoperedenaceae archaeon]
MSTPSVSVIIPCMNEEKTIGNCIRKAMSVFEHEGLEGEIIVSDSSTDGSRHIAESMGAKVVIPESKGYGNAYIEGIKHARGKYIVLSDADDTYDLSEMPKFLTPLLAGEADFVIGSRIKGVIKDNSMPWLHRYVGNPVLTWMLNRFFNMNISDAHCGMRVITKNAYERLEVRSAGMEFASEMLIEAGRKKLRVMEIPITYYPRQTPSKLHTWGDGWRHLRFMMLYNPRPFFSIPGLLLASLGIFMIFILSMQNNVENIRIHSFILGSMLVIIGFQMIATGIYMKVYGIIRNKIDKTGITSKILDYHSLEHGLVIGSLLFMGGMILGSNVLYKWMSSGFGSLSEVGNAVVSMVLAAMGIQVIFSTLIISIFMLEQKENQ